MVDWAFDISLFLAGFADVELTLLASVVALLTAITTVVAVVAETILNKL